MRVDGWYDKGDGRERERERERGGACHNDAGARCALCVCAPRLAPFLATGDDNLICVFFFLPGWGEREGRERPLYLPFRAHVCVPPPPSHLHTLLTGHQKVPHALEVVGERWRCGACVHVRACEFWGVCVGGAG